MRMPSRATWERQALRREYCATCAAVVRRGHGDRCRAYRERLARSRRARVAVGVAVLVAVFVAWPLGALS